MNRAPAFQFYPDKWIAHTEHLSDAAYRAYHRLLCWMWLHGSPPFRIKSDPKILRIATGLNPSNFDEVWSEIQQPDFYLLRKRGRYLYSNGLQKEYEKQEQRRRQCREAANARWSHSERNAKASSPQCTPSPSPSPSPTTTTGKDPPTPQSPILDEPRRAYEAKFGVMVPDLAAFSDMVAKFGPGWVMQAIAQSKLNRLPYIRAIAKDLWTKGPDETGTADVKTGYEAELRELFTPWPTKPAGRWKLLATLEGYLMGEGHEFSYEHRQRVLGILLAASKSKKPVDMAIRGLRSGLNVGIGHAGSPPDWASKRAKEEIERHEKPKITAAVKQVAEGLSDG